jgi:hypothetical protein
LYLVAPVGIGVLIMLIVALITNNMAKTLNIQSFGFKELKLEEASQNAKTKLSDNQYHFIL